MSKTFPSSALMIIDVQQAIDDPSWGRRNNSDAERCMCALLEHWRERGWPVIHVRHESLDPDSTYRPGQRGCAFKKEVQPRDEEHVVTKHVNSAFIGTALDGWLKARNIGSLVICGVITNNSVEATARMAGNLGYLTYVVSDATATFDRVDLNGMLHLAEQMHSIALSNLAGDYAQIVTSSEVLNGVPARPAFTACTSLSQVRANIDRIDREIVALLAERGRYVHEAARFKTSEETVRASDRVEQVIAKVRNEAALFGAEPSIVEAMYRSMIEGFIRAELDDWRRRS